MDPALAATSAGQEQFPCEQCGANLQFQPGSRELACPYCGARNAIPDYPQPVQEMDLVGELSRLGQDADTYEALTVKCQACAAESTLKPNVTADLCPFCGSPIVATAASRKAIKPQCILPFHVSRDQAMAAFRRWLGSLWFAPSGLLKSAEAAGIGGVYIPAWTYDADTRTWYSGQRGDDYWVTESYTTRENGRTVRRTRQVPKTRWRWVSGVVDNRFDDLLVLAAESLPRRQAEALEPWDLKSAQPYTDEFLAGFRSQSYQIDLAQGFERAKALMVDPIHRTICRDIGGDHQRVHSTDTRYFNLTYKHILLPVWISAYRYHERTFRFLVNARTGEVQGERPYSAWKIALAVLAAILVAAIALLIWQAQR